MRHSSRYVGRQSSVALSIENIEKLRKSCLKILFGTNFFKIDRTFWQSTSEQTDISGAGGDNYVSEQLDKYPMLEG